MITEMHWRCQYENCERPATHFACGRHDSLRDKRGHGLGCYCEAHAELVADENSPEYTTSCPNCGCLFGVN